MAIWALILGTAAGLALGGPLGALAGAAVVRSAGAAVAAVRRPLTERRQVASPPDHERGLLKQSFGLRVQGPAVEPDDCYAAHRLSHAVISSAPGLAPTGSRVSKSTMIACISRSPPAYSRRLCATRPQSR